MVDFDHSPPVNLRLCLQNNMRNNSYGDPSEVFDSYTPLEPDTDVTE
jgi:hypothetical protein